MKIGDHGWTRKHPPSLYGLSCKLGIQILCADRRRSRCTWYFNRRFSPWVKLPLSILSAPRPIRRWIALQPAPLPRWTDKRPMTILHRAMARCDATRGCTCAALVWTLVAPKAPIFGRPFPVPIARVAATFRLLRQPNPSLQPHPRCHLMGAFPSVEPRQQCRSSMASGLIAKHTLSAVPTDSLLSQTLQTARQSPRVSLEAWFLLMAVSSRDAVVEI